MTKQEAVEWLRLEARKAESHMEHCLEQARDERDGKRGEVSGRKWQLHHNQAAEFKHYADVLDAIADLLKEPSAPERA